MPEAGSMLFAFNCADEALEAVHVCPSSTDCSGHPLSLSLSHTRAHTDTDTHALAHSESQLSLESQLR